MSRVLIAGLLGIIVFTNAINRPVYKIVLTQKGYAQFLQYDVITPPLSEFTICTWIRVYDLLRDQSIFTYVVDGNNRVIRLWLDSGGQLMTVSFDGKMTSKMTVNIVKDVWRHICLSYQSDFGAWAVYIDSRLVACESLANLQGSILPGGGSVILGYGTGDDGTANGLEGELFGANMILSSTIERNFTLKSDPVFGQKKFPRNKLKNAEKQSNYVILSDLLKIHNNFEKTNIAGKRAKKYNTFLEPHSFEEASSTKKLLAKAPSAKKEFEFKQSDFRPTDKEEMDYWNSNENSKFPFDDMSHATKSCTATSLLRSATDVIPTVSEYETPPPLQQNFYSYKIKESREPSRKFDYNLSKDITAPLTTIRNKLHVTELYDLETPPPIDNSNKVYGQWTSSKFAGNVLNYLKSINLKNRENLMKRVPQTIPFYKISDSHPYPSDFKINIVRPPSQFKNRKLVEKRFDIIRRDPQIKAHILEDDIKLNIIKVHAETEPKKVEINGQLKPKQKRNRFYRDTRSKNNFEEENSDEVYEPKPFYLKEERKKNHRYFIQPTASTSKSHKSSRVPVLRSNDELIEESNHKNTQVEDDIQYVYIKNISQGNKIKWRNAKSYNNDYTPHKLNLEHSNIQQNHRNPYPSHRLKHTPKRESQEEIDPSILNARKLAHEISNQSFIPRETITSLKFKKEQRIIEKNYPRQQFNSESDNRKPYKRNMKPTHFDQQVKIGNALNERVIIGIEDDRQKISFEGGNDNVPDINKYRSDLDNENTNVPSSLQPRICRSIDSFDRILYVQPDESIDLTHIVSPLKEKNMAVEFVLQNYKKCSLTDSSFQKDAMLLIDWSKTPVRLFGGAHPRTTTDLCGFF